MKSKKKPNKIQIIAKSSSFIEKNKKKDSLNASKNTEILQTEPTSSNSNLNTINTLPSIKEKLLIVEEKKKEEKIEIDKILNNNNNPNNNEINNKTNNDINNQEKTKKKFKFYYFKKSKNLYFFIKKSNKEIKEIESKEFELKEEIEIPEVYYPYMNTFDGIQECYIETCKNGNFDFKTKLNECNIIWSLQHKNQMLNIVKKLSKYQKFSYFPSTYTLGRKDTMYRHFKRFKRLFPDDYKFVPLSFIMPTDGDKFKEVDGDLKKKWIVKPVNLSRGRGIHILKDTNELWHLTWKSQYNQDEKFIVCRYISNPHIILNKKYDLRIYVLIASYTPLRIYLYNNGLVRFATEDYNKNNVDNIYVYLTNFSINVNNPKYKSNQNEENEDEDSSKWSLNEYRNYFNKIGKPELFTKIWNQINDIVIKSIMTVANEISKDININKLNSVFELYGFDIMIDENFKCWLIEVNVKPSMQCTSPLDLDIKTNLITDIFNIVGVYPYHHKIKECLFSLDNNNNSKLPEIKKKKNIYFNKETDSQLLYLKSDVKRYFNDKNMKKFKEEYNNPYYKKMVNDAIEEIERSSLTDFKLIFPLKENLEIYSKFLIRDGADDTNIVFWQYILTN